MVKRSYTKKRASRTSSAGPKSSRYRTAGRTGSKVAKRVTKSTSKKITKKEMSAFAQAFREHAEVKDASQKRIR